MRWINKTARRARRILDAPEELSQKEPIAIAYADDMTILGRSVRETQYILDKADQRFGTLGLTVNPTKTQVTVLYPRCLPTSDRNPIFQLKGTDLQLQKVVRLLGTFIDEDLTFQPAHQRMAQQLAVAKAKVLRSATGPPAVSLRVYHAIGAGKLMHTLPVVAPPTAYADHPWWLEGVWRRGLRAILGLPFRASSELTLWESGMISLAERAHMLRQNLLKAADDYPESAVLIDQVVQEQKEMADAGLNPGKPIPDTALKSAKRVLSIFPAIIEHQVSEHQPMDLLQCHIRRWKRWLRSEWNRTTEPDVSPLRWLHRAPSSGTADAATYPVWLKYAPGGTTARALAAIRGGWSCHSADVQRLVRQDICPQCEKSTADLRHLISCPDRRQHWTFFLQKWCHGIVQITPAEKIAILAAEAPHRCSAIRMTPTRMQLWRQRFHFKDNMERRKYWTGLLQLLRLLLSHVTPEPDSS